MWNQTLFRKVLVRSGRIADHEYEEPFASLLGTHNAQIVEVAGIEPASSGDLLGLLRAQPADRLARRLPQAEHRRTSLASVSPMRHEAHLVG